MKTAYQRAIPLLLIVFCLAASVSAQNTNIGQTFAAVNNGVLTIYPSGGAPIAVDNPSNKGISNLVWSRDGSKLTYFLMDENYQSHIMITDSSGSQPVMLDTGALESGFPISFTDDGSVLYAGQGKPADPPSTDYFVQVERIQPVAGA